MKALSIRQPWAWLIANGYKSIENRTWDTNVRGPIAIHAGKTFDRHGYDWVCEFFPHIEMPRPDEFERGGIIGVAIIIGVLSGECCSFATQIRSLWFFGPFGFTLCGQRPVPFVQLRGQLGFFNVPDDVIPEDIVGDIIK